MLLGVATTRYEMIVRECQYITSLWQKKKKRISCRYFIWAASAVLVCLLVAMWHVKRRTFALLSAHYHLVHDRATFPAGTNYRGFTVLTNNVGATTFGGNHGDNSNETSASKPQE